MRRSNEGSAAQPERGNFTPPSRAEASPAEVPGTGSAGDGGSHRLSPRNWRVATG